MIFGTDGIRARVGQSPMDRNTIERISAVLGFWLPEDAKVVIGSDTRSSCEDIRSWITAHLGSVDVIDLGVVPTPVVAFETRERGAHLGVMITASHNPACDNGLKFFDSQGLKVLYDQARKWSEAVEKLETIQPTATARIQKAEPEHYRTFIHQHFKAAQFENLSVAFDLAHGAASYFVKQMLDELKVNVTYLGDQPNGENINDGVGALHPDSLAAVVSRDGLDAGFALDGDADRLILTDDREVPGDVTIFALYEIMKAEGIEVSGVVGTIMCGMGLEQTFAKHDVAFHRTGVGDQKVLAKLVSDDLLLGGEPSGHLIQCDLFPAGDGFLGALRLMRALNQDKSIIAKARAAVPMFPTFEKSYRVGSKPEIQTKPELVAFLDDFQKELGGSGRHIVRYSGTEPKIRVFVEAPDLAPFEGRIGELEALIGRVLV